MNRLVIASLLLAACGDHGLPQELGDLPPPPSENTGTVQQRYIGPTGSNGGLLAYGDLTDTSAHSYCLTVPGGSFVEGAVLDIETCPSVANLSGLPLSIAWMGLADAATNTVHVYSNSQWMYDVGGLNGGWYVGTRFSKVLGAYQPVITKVQSQITSWRLFGAQWCATSGPANGKCAQSRSSTPAAAAVILATFNPSNAGSLWKGHFLHTALQYGMLASDGHALYADTGSCHVMGCQMFLSEGTGVVHGVDYPAVSAEVSPVSDYYAVRSGPVQDYLGISYTDPLASPITFLTDAVWENFHPDFVQVIASVYSGGVMQQQVIEQNDCLTAPSATAGAVVGNAVPCTPGAATQQFFELYR